MSGMCDTELLRNANVRLCRLRLWSNCEGLGFQLEESPRPPHIIRLVESNSPAAAGGLKILDVVLAVNQEDVSKTDYDRVRDAIRTARDSNIPIELLVAEKYFYQMLKTRNISINSHIAIIINTPETMPSDYLNFPKYVPRTCYICLNETETSFGFEVIHGENDIGVYIQEVFPNTLASRTLLRKCDRIIEINDKYVDKDLSKSILEKLSKAKKQGAVKLYVVDTETYKYVQVNKISLTSKAQYQNQLTDLPINHGNQSSLSNTSTIRDKSKVRTSSVDDFTQSTKSQGLPITIPSSSILLLNKNMNLCSSYRVNSSDTFDIELNHHNREKFHSLTIVLYRENGRLSKILNGEFLLKLVFIIFVILIFIINYLSIISK